MNHYSTISVNEPAWAEGRQINYSMLAIAAVCGTLVLFALNFGVGTRGLSGNALISDTTDPSGLSTSTYAQRLHD